MQPSVLTVLPTYQCTAACKECCFECAPSVHGRIPLDRILGYLDEAAATVPTIELVVFSGGECFLLGRDLDAAIARATEHGWRTRCVTNGYWARGPAGATRRLEKLQRAGLGELNISTGDDHQQWVPFEHVVNAAIAGADLGMLSVIVVEGFENSRFRADDALHHPRIAQYRETSPNAAYLQVLRNIWMPFHEDRSLEHEQSLHRTTARIPSLSGCDNVLHNAVITPDESLASCCGLTMEHIPEMKLGKLGEVPMRTMIDRGAQDFLKIWIWLDGPERVLKFASEKDPSVVYPENNVHPCQACAQFYLSPEAREAVRQHWREVRDDVLLRYELKVALLAQQGARPPATSRSTPTVVGHGDR